MELEGEGINYKQIILQIILAINERIHVCNSFPDSAGNG